MPVRRPVPSPAVVATADTMRLSLGGWVFTARGGKLPGLPCCHSRVPLALSELPALPALLALLVLSTLSTLFALFAKFDRQFRCALPRTGGACRTSFESPHEELSGGLLGSFSFLLAKLLCLVKLR